MTFPFQLLRKLITSLSQVLFVLSEVVSVDHPALS